MNAISKNDRIITLSNDMITAILVDLDDKSLINTCSTNKEIKHICSKDYLWQLRMQKYYPTHYQHKPTQMSYEDFYKKYQHDLKHISYRKPSFFVFDHKYGTYFNGKVTINGINVKSDLISGPLNRHTVRMISERKDGVDFFDGTRRLFSIDQTSKNPNELDIESGDYIETFFLDQTN
jgi:hypothetical protein